MPFRRSLNCILLATSETQVEPIHAVEKAWIYGFLHRENRVKAGFRMLPIHKIGFYNGTDAGMV